VPLEMFILLAILERFPVAFLLHEVKKATRSRAKKKTSALKGSKDRIACTLAAGMMLALVRPMR
jgi:hypothetical protein